MDAQGHILGLYRAGRHGEAFALQLDLDCGGLRRARERALELLAADPGRLRLFACGDYVPRRRAAPGAGRPFSEAILRLKGLRMRSRFARLPDALPLTDALAVRLARGLRALERSGALGAGAPVYVSPVPGAAAGPLSFGLCRVAERACVLAGSGFRFRTLLLRGADLPPAHLGAAARRARPQVESLMPLRDPAVRGRTVVLVDDVVSSGWTLRASAALVALTNGARTLGLALGRTPAVRRDAAGVSLILPPTPQTT